MSPRTRFILSSDFMHQAATLLRSDRKGDSCVDQFQPGFWMRVAQPSSESTTKVVRSAVASHSHTLHPIQYQVQGLAATYAEMIDIVENGGTGVSTAVEARKTLQIMLGFLESHQQGNRLVDVPS